MFKYDDLIVISDKKDRKYLLTLKEGERFSTNYGFIEHDHIIPLEEGDTVKSSQNHDYLVYKPTYMDYVMNIKRQAQIIYPKDAAVMLMWGDIGPNQKVLESGIGQGALSIAILRALGDTGSLTSYEIREDFASQSANFIKKYFGKTPDNHRIEVRSIYNGIDDTFDRILLDLPEPWEVVPHLEKGLKNGGVIVAYIPTVLQVKNFVESLKATKLFSDIETAEFTRRPWKVDGLSIRPEMWIYSHSAFIVSARKLKPFADISSRQKNKMKAQEKIQEKIDNKKLNDNEEQVVADDSNFLMNSKSFEEE